MARLLIALTWMFLCTENGSRFFGSATLISHRSRSQALEQDNENIVSKSADANWVYNWNKPGSRPDEWLTSWKTCGGTRQSPIQILTTSSIRSADLEPLRLVDYDDTPKDHTWQFTNTGHGVQIQADFYSPPQLQGGSLPGKYSFQQVHLHWGGNNSVGSEHSMDGKQYPLEMHLVHRKKNKNQIEAEGDEAGLAVLGILFETTSNKADVSPTLSSFLSSVKDVSESASSFMSAVSNFTLSDLCPDNLSYMRYMGSLTTPPCTEAVIWTVLTTPQKITQEQLDILRSIWAESPNNSSQGIKLQDNYRPIQPLNGRVVHLFTASSSSHVWSVFHFVVLLLSASFCAKMV